MARRKTTNASRHGGSQVARAAQGVNAIDGVSRFAALRGSRKTSMSTDEAMNLLRGYDEDACDPGFSDNKAGEHP